MRAARILQPHIRATSFAAALALAACAQPAPRDSTSAAAGPTHASEAGSFAHLNALRVEANKLKSPLGVYLFWHEQYLRGADAERQLVGQALAAAAAEVGAYDEAVRTFPMGVTHLGDTPAPPPASRDFQAVNAAEGVAGLARDRRIVMVNEAHHVAQTRLLTLALLPLLRAQGFTHFAAEALDERDRNLATRGYPTVASGSYVREPLYGDIVRSALKLGFVVVPYESASASADIATREEEQAQHLVERVFRAQPDARLFVHAGYAHIHRRGDYLFETDTMAMRLKRKTGFDPLSVDTTMLRPIDAAREYPGYAELLRRFPVTQPSILLSRKDATAWSLEPSIYDVSLLLPRPDHLIVGRPDWLSLGGERETVAVDIDVRDERLPCLIEARYAAESDKAVPADRALVERNGTQALLFLRPGEYRITAIDADGREFERRTLRVDRADRNESARPAKLAR